MTATDTLTGAVDAITARLDARDLDGARAAFDDAVRGGQEAVEPLVRALAATVTVQPGLAACALPSCTRPWAASWGLEPA